jgi:hypothetical protein
MGDYEHVEDWEHEHRIATRLAASRGWADHALDAASMVGVLAAMAVQLAVMAMVWVVSLQWVDGIIGYSRGKSK